MSEKNYGDENTLGDRNTLGDGNTLEAVARERESCAKVCDERAEKCAAKADVTDDQDERTELKAIAWQFSVLAAEIRKRSNA